jgi:hypothetical protein
VGGALGDINSLKFTLLIPTDKGKKFSAWETRKESKIVLLL